WRLLLDAGSADRTRIADELSLALSRAADAGAGAAWLEGFLAGSGLVLVHDERLLGLVDEWLAGLAGEQFEEVLPLVRRSFSVLSGPERRQVAERVKRTRVGDGAGASGAAEDAQAGGLATELDLARAEPALDLVAQILGVTLDGR
ncbi:MAG TPA: DUF5682 family protein, partial [Solirubrobacteraceae bacterium]|nr:DUF5682 family protein [Solirubrobacteraceae bacterium]